MTLLFQKKLLPLLVLHGLYLCLFSLESLCQFVNIGTVLLLLEDGLILFLNGLVDSGFSGHKVTTECGNLLLQQTFVRFAMCLLKGLEAHFNRPCPFFGNGRRLLRRGRPLICRP